METIEKASDTQCDSSTFNDPHAITILTGKVSEGMSNKAMYVSIDTAKCTHNKYIQ